MNKGIDLLNWATAGIILSALMGILPPLAALVGLTYYCILIFESETLRGWRQHRRLQKLARLKAKLEHLETPMAPPPPPEEQLPPAI